VNISITLLAPVAEMTRVRGYMKIISMAKATGPSPAAASRVLRARGARAEPRRCHIVVVLTQCHLA
jgi:hypothetical protein